MIKNGPKVYLISQPSLNYEEISRFLLDRKLNWIRSGEATQSEELVELSGRICYMSLTGDSTNSRQPNSRYIRHIIDEGHESVLEHANWTLLIDRVSRAFTHQLVRHRVGFSFSQLSQQYHDESDTDFVVPAELFDRPELLSRWEGFMEEIKGNYQTLMKNLSEQMTPGDKEGLRGIRSAARSMLPNATQTTIAVTANARALRHFLSVRGAIVGDLEMRQVASQILEAVQICAPAIFSDFKTEIHPEDGRPIVLKIN